MLVFLFLTIGAKSQNYFHLYDDRDTSGVSKDAMSTEIMTDRIKKSAELYAKYAPVPRFTEMDFSFGADLEEYKKLSGYGILYIPSLNQDSSEYPIKKVYIKFGNTITELQKIGEIPIETKDKTIAATFGKHRIDYYYLIPYQLTLTYGELMIDWSTNRKEFILTKFPNQNLLDFEVKDVDTNKPIDEQFLKTFLKREYGIESN